MAWNEPGGNKNPWERRPGQGQSDLDEMVRNWQRKIAAVFGGGPGGRGPSSGVSRLNWGSIALLLVAIWGVTGFYQVDSAEQAIVTRFGRHVETTSDGLRWHWPWPIESRQIVNVAKNDSIDDKTRMLTADENLVDISIAVQFIRSDPIKYVFRVRSPEETLRDVSESAIREVIGQNKLEFVLGAGRQEITEKTEVLIQGMLNFYETGIEVITVNLTAVNVPEQVAPSQKDAIKAREDRDRFSQEAQAYLNDVVPKSQGEAARLRLDAQAFRTRVVAEAEGETARFGQLLTAYERAPNVTRDRLYIETVENVLARSRKVLLDTRPGSSVIYLPLDKLLEKGTASGTDAAALLAAPPVARPQEGPVETITVDPRNRGER